MNISFIEHKYDVNDIKWCFRKAQIKFRNFQVLEIVSVGEEPCE